jgi:hypothetical protein
VSIAARERGRLSSRFWEKVVSQPRCPRQGQVVRPKARSNVYRASPSNPQPKRADLGGREQGAVSRRRENAGYFGQESPCRSHHRHVILAPMAERPVVLPPQRGGAPCLTPVFTQLAARSIEGRQVRCTPARCRCRTMITPLALDAVPRATGRARSHPRRRSTAARASFTITGCAVHVVTHGSRCCTFLFEMPRS